MQQLTPAPGVQNTVFQVAAFAVVDLVAVALIEFGLGAETPNGKLNEPWKFLRVVRIESPGIYSLRNPPNDFGAAVGAVTGQTVDVFRTQFAQDARTVQPIVNQ